MGGGLTLASCGTNLNFKLTFNPWNSPTNNSFDDSKNELNSKDWTVDYSFNKWYFNLDKSMQQTTKISQNDDERVTKMHGIYCFALKEGATTPSEFTSLDERNSWTAANYSECVTLNASPFTLIQNRLKDSSPIDIQTYEFNYLQINLRWSFKESGDYPKFNLYFADVNIEQHYDKSKQTSSEKVIFNKWSSPTLCTLGYSAP